MSVAVGLVLASLPVTAAIAKKAKASSSSRSWTVPDAFRAQAELADADIKARSFGSALQKIDALDGLAKKADEKYLSGVLRYQVGLARDDLKQLYLGSANMLSSGGTPDGDLGVLSAAAGRYAFLMTNYKSARTYLAEAAKRGKGHSDQSIMMAESAFKLGLMADGVAGVRDAAKLAASEGRPVPISWFERAEAHLVAAGAVAELADLGRDHVRARQTPLNWYARLVNLAQVGAKKTGTPATAKLDSQSVLDLFRLAREAKGVVAGSEILLFSEYALRNGAPAEANVALKEGLANLALPAGDKQAATLLAQVGAAKAKSVTGAGEGAKLAADGDWALQSGVPDKAVGLYQKALGKPGAEADLVNTRLGIALTRTNRKAEARKAFEAVAGARKAVADYWLLWLELNP